MRKKKWSSSNLPQKSESDEGRRQRAEGGEGVKEKRKKTKGLAAGDAMIFLG
jgi:hypothetical protein